MCQTAWSSHLLVAGGGGALLPGVPRWCVMAGVCGRWGTCCQSDSALSSRHIMSNAWDASCVTADLPVCPAYMHSSPECVCMSMCACVVLVVFAKKRPLRLRYADGFVIALHLCQRGSLPGFDHGAPPCFKERVVTVTSVRFWQHVTPTNTPFLWELV